MKKCFLLLASCFLLLSSCATSFDSKGRYHRVQSGETIWKIARAYRVPVQDLAELNNIQNDSKLEAGQRLYLPQRPRGKSWKKLPKEKEALVFDAPIKVDRKKFIWPVDGTVFSQFGIRNGRRHDGIDISAPAGTKIRAAANGKVAFAGRLGGYGNVVILRHDGDFFTTYAHNTKNGAKKGDNIKQGQIIAYVGKTGRASGPHCHFEIRDGQKARNPLFFLPVR